jgi:hypothetical protein
LFVKVSGRVAGLLGFSTDNPKFNGGAVMGNLPVPERAMTADPMIWKPESITEKLIEPACAPDTMGLNSTERVQFAPGAKGTRIAALESGQFEEVMENPAVITSACRYTVDGPELVNWTACVGEVRPT